MSFELDFKHDLTEFTPAPAVQFKSERSGEGVKLSGNLAKTRPESSCPNKSRLSSRRLSCRAKMLKMSTAFQAVARRYLRRPRAYPGRRR